MTTIACDGKSMAGDGQRESCRTIVDTGAIKVFELSEGRIYGACGDTAYSQAVMAWLGGAEKPDFNPAEGFAALILMRDGSIRMIGDSLCEPIPVQAPVAIGSGMDFAIGAMEHGASPKEAVEIASKRDPSTGGAITVIAL